MEKSSCRVYWTRGAEADLIELIEYIARDNEAAAREVYVKIRDQALGFGAFPERGRIIPELLLYSIDGYREIIITPWRLMYRIDGDTVYVLALIDGRRNIDDILLNRIMRGGRPPIRA